MDVKRRRNNEKYSAESSYNRKGFLRSSVLSSVLGYQLRLLLVKKSNTLPALIQKYYSKDS